MATVHPDGPKILTQDPAFSARDPSSDEPDGRPNADAMSEMWSIVFFYLKLIGRDGLKPRRPTPPTWITDHSFPSPPWSTYDIDDNPARGADVSEPPSKKLAKLLHILDVFLAVLAFLKYVAAVIIWLVTILPGLALDLLTKWVRDAIYHVQLVFWYLYILARRPLVMLGFLIPKPEEMDLGLTNLGMGRGEFDIEQLLDDPTAQSGFSHPTIDEPSGRPTATSVGLDDQYPRNVVRDIPGQLDFSLTDLIRQTGQLHYAGDKDEWHPSEWLAPWRYPTSNQAGQNVAPEMSPVHAGPYVAGDPSSVLLPGPLGSADARAQLEQCTSPAETYNALNQLFPQDKHLGGPVDYGVYLIGRMIAERGNVEFGVPDFNLDSDRGYAWRCWDFDRHNAGTQNEWMCWRDFTPTPQSDFHYLQPCTPPHFFHADTDNPHQKPPPDSQWYDSMQSLRVHYLSGAPLTDPPPDGPDPCGSGASPTGGPP
jgi:hypothetical protein